MYYNIPGWLESTYTPYAYIILLILSAYIYLNYVNIIIFSL